ncbi:esterase/lipase family protein [Frigoribacterium salinisoli]
MADRSPRRRIGPLRVLRTLALDYVFVVRIHLVGRGARTVPRTWKSGDRAPVLLLPGVFETWRFLRPVAERLAAAGHPIVVVPGLAHNSRPIQETAERAQAVLDAHDLRGVVVLAHSKGGLIGKTMMVQTDSDDRIDRMVSVNSPYSGSRWALLLPAPQLRVFSPRDADLLHLAENLEVNARVTSLFSGFDLHVPEGSVLPGATNVELAVDGHFRPLGHRASQDLAVLAVEEGPAAAGSAPGVRLVSAPDAVVDDAAATDDPAEAALRRLDPR